MEGGESVVMNFKRRVYVDASVIGGCMDRELAEASLAFIDMAKREEVELVISSHLADELLGVPEGVKAIFASIPESVIEQVTVTPEAIALRDLHLQAGIVGPSASDDALHVAIAAVARVDLILSWNFKHIVHVDKIRKFNAVNTFHGFPAVEIRTPKGVI